jgi:CrcB protein
LFVNVTGSFALGMIAGSALHGLPRSAVATGFLGAYTTFSAYAYEGVHLAESRRGHAAATYLIGTVLVTTAAAWLGLVLTS